MKQLLLITFFFFGYNTNVFSQNHILQVRLNGIFMGECGNNNHCTHEPVSGIVTLDFATMIKGIPNRVPSNDEQIMRSLAWENGNYELVCSNYMAFPRQYSIGDEGSFMIPESEPIANNIYRSFYYTVSNEDWRKGIFQIRTRINLGCQHKDNFMASNGEHWMSNDNMILDIREFRTFPDNPGYRHVITFGPYETDSDRCHEFWVQFTVFEYGY
jgi:hypothetical protein